jgi:glycosyltransferase involved in cell wall biosynthesis
MQRGKYTAWVQDNNLMEVKIVSVVIPAYNQGHYLGRAIQSVLDQTYTHFEILVIDDGSTDDTAVIAKSFPDPRVRYIYQENRGLSGARNTGVRSAIGEYISYLDADDLFLPTKLERLVHELQTNPSLGFVAGQAIPIDENDQPTGKLYAIPIPIDPARLLLGNPLHVGSVMVDRKWQDAAGPFDESLRSYEDWDMWIRLARLGCKMGWVDEPVSLYRFHTAQMTRIGTQMTNATFAVLDKIYSGPALPDTWKELHDLAYSNANLRAMAQAYHHEDYPHAKNYLREATRLNPGLLADNADELAKILAALADSPKIPNSLDFLERIYTHLPEEMEALQQRGPQDLSRTAIQAAFSAYGKHDYLTARRSAQRAIQYQPGWVRNRGVLAVLMKSYTRPIMEFIFTS